MANSYKKFLITGASQGIGKAIALKLLKHNFKVIGISRKHTIKNSNYIPYSQDLYDLKGFSKTLDEIKKNHSNITGIVSNAGEGVFNKLENISENKITSYFNLNLYLIFYWQKK